MKPQFSQQDLTELQIYSNQLQLYGGQLQILGNNVQILANHLESLGSSLESIGNIISCEGNRTGIIATILQQDQQNNSASNSNDEIEAIHTQLDQINVQIQQILDYIKR